MQTRIFLVAGIGILIVCCLCAGIFLGLQLSPAKDSLSNPLASFNTRPTPTPDKDAPVALQTPTVTDTGLEITAIGFQRPLKVQGAVQLSPNEQFILVTVKLANTKKTGSPLTVRSADFKVKGDGGLTYEANPKTITIPQQLTETAIAPGKSIEAELIYQVATNDTALTLYWGAGKTGRVIQLEKQK